MVMEGNPEFGVELEPIDFAKVAEAFGMKGIAVDNPRDVPSALREGLAPVMLAVLSLGPTRSAPRS